MKTTLTSASLGPIEERLRVANAKFVADYPGEPRGRQPVHTVYGGAHLFRRDTVDKLAQNALRALAEHAADAATFASALAMTGSAPLLETVYRRVIAKLETEPVEDLRIDFEDGFGTRPDEEEDATAVFAARELAAAMAASTLPPFVGLRVKSLAEETRSRALRTLDLFITAMVEATRGPLPPRFVVTVPKVMIEAHVDTIATVVAMLERALSLTPGAIGIEIMVETPQSLMDSAGALMLPRLIRAGEGRVVGAHFGTYDYTAACNITAAHQSMRHPACDHARAMMQVACAGSGVFVSDGATNVLPVPVHRAREGRPLSREEESDNRASVHAAWRLQYDQITDSLMRGFYQGWDLHPAQLPVRYAATYSFFLRSAGAAAERLKNFVARAAQATLLGDVFDDAATGQGLLNHFLRALSCGAMDEAEVLAKTGLSAEEIRSRSFTTILQLRRGE